MIFSNFDSTYPNDPLRNINFEKYKNLINTNIVFFYGTNPPNQIMDTFPGKAKVFFSSEEQWDELDSTNNFANNVDRVITICPPIITGRHKRVSGFWPLDLDLVNLIPTNDKKFDICYFGGNYGHHLNEVFECMGRFNTAHSNHNGSISYTDKLALTATSKIAICHNLVGPSFRSKIATPQLKTRCFEAAFCKSLMLVCRDTYNIIEEWFTPGIDFIYYDMGKLQESISWCLDNYNSLSGFIDRAYDKAINKYTTEKFIKRFLQ